MRRIRLDVLGLVLGVGATSVVACSGGDDRPPVNAQDGRNTSGNGSGGSAGESGEGSTNDTSTTGSGADGAAPVVELLSPKDEDSPEKFYNESLGVACQVTESEEPGSRSVDKASIRIELIGDEDAVLDTLPGVEGHDADVFEASFPVQNVAAGPVRVRCSAADTAATPRIGSDEVQTFLDHGPVITVISPLPESAKSALGAVPFEFEVSPFELVDDDDDAAVESVTLSVKGEDFEIEEDEDRTGVYATTIDFSDPTIFAEIPEGPTSVAFTATNARGVARVERYNFLLDSIGPAVAIHSPVDGQVVGGTVNLEIDLPPDASGVNLDTLVVRLNNEDYHYDPTGPWTLRDEQVVFQFESADVVGSIVQINVNVRVEDNAGNESGASALLYRDEQPPVVSLDPPNFRAVNESNGQCSYSFDPVGPLAPGHEARVGSLEFYRALVWDTTNDAGGDVLHMAGTDPESVRLFARIPDDPLVVDTTEDGVCDDIADEMDVGFQDLTALGNAGTPWFGPEETEPPPDEPERGTCPYGTSENPPVHLCDDRSDLITVPHHSNIPTEPIIYAVSPAASSQPECTGREWELPSVVPYYEGWVCLAVRAEDRVGNRGISKPIAVCLDNNDIEGEPSCWTDLEEAPPDCTDGCDDPLELDPDGVFYEH